MISQEIEILKAQNEKMRVALALIIEREDDRIARERRAFGLKHLADVSIHIIATEALED